MFEADQIRLISETLAAASDDRCRLAYAFYAELFEALPEARAIFSGDLADHVPRFMGMLQSIPLAIEMPDDMSATLRDIGQTHYLLGVRREHYGPMYGSVLLALEKTSGRAWSEDAAAAWRLFLDHARADMLAGWEQAATSAGHAVDA